MPDRTHLSSSRKPANAGCAEQRGAGSIEDLHHFLGRSPYQPSRFNCKTLTFDYDVMVFKVVFTASFDRWLEGLRDAQTRRRLVLRLRKASLGQLGDVKPVAQGIYEMREFFGPGWRMYYARRGDVLIVMLGGGTKGTQARDIEKAIALAETIED